MNSPTLVLVLLFVLFLLLDVPVAVAICLSTFATAALVKGTLGIAAATIAERMATGVYSFSLLAIPFFIALIAALMVVTFIPALSNWLPDLFGMN